MLREHVGVRNRSGTITGVLLVLMGSLGHQVGAVSIDMVTVGNPGNAGDTRHPSGVPNSGAVPYAYRIGKHEVTAGQYTAFLNAVGGVDTYALYNAGMWTGFYGCKIARSGGGTPADPYVYSVAPAAADRPVSGVSWGDAARFANWLANGQPTGAQGLGTTEDGSYYLNGATTDAALMGVARKPNATWVIPTADEWYKAAYYDLDKPGGAGYWNYATRSIAAPGRDMSELTNPGNNANSLGAPFPIDPPYYTTVVGQFHLSASAYGTFDQSGNVAEWNESALSGSSRGVRGGSFFDYSYYLGGGSGLAPVPSQESDGFGFRVGEVPEPGLLHLLAVGGLALVIRRK
jgi:sulfatase modifying factor 1